MILLPRLNPACDPLTVRLQIPVLLALQFHHDIIVESRPCLVGQHAKDFGVDVLLEFGIRVISRSQAISSVALKTVGQ